MYVKVPLENGETFLVDTEVGGSGVVRATRGEDLIKASSETFEESLDRIRHVAEAILSKLTDMASAPTQVRAEFGVSLSAEAGAVVVKGSADAHFVLELQWKRESAD